MSIRAWALLTLFLILLGLAVYVLLTLHATANDPWRDVSIARYVAIGCGVAAAVALAIGALPIGPWRRTRSGTSSCQDRPRPLAGPGPLSAIQRKRQGLVALHRR
jgi:hypothetical protein